MNVGKRLLLLQTGDAPGSVRTAHGNFDQMFTLAAGLKAEQVEVIFLPAGERPKAPEHYAGVLITGSASMVTERLPWSEYAADWLRQALDSPIPIFGVCYGHQLLAHALGGSVDFHPAGRELGSHEIALAPEGTEDQLLAGMPPRFTAQLIHSQSVLTPPAGATVLGGSKHDPHQILRYSATVVSTQFHPEFSAEVMHSYLTWLSEHEPEQREAHWQTDQGIVESPHSQALLARFVQQCLG